MKISTKFLMSIMTFVFFNVANFQLQAQVKVTEETMDAAYDAPSTMVVGTWVMDSGAKYIFKKDGTMEMKLVSVVKDGVRGILTIYYEKWRKTNDEIFFSQKPDAEGVKWNIDPSYKLAYEKLSNRKKDEFDTWMNNIARDYISPTFSRWMTPKLLYISNDYMVLKFESGETVTFKKEKD